MRVGVDIIRVSKVKEAVSRRGMVLLERVLTEEELREVRTRELAREVATHWAAKEAAAKLLRRGIFEVGLRSVELRHRSDGSPYLNFLGKGRELLLGSGLRNIDVSISHDGDYVVVVVVAEEMWR